MSYAKPGLMRELDVEIWLNDPQDPLEHQISSLFEEYWRVCAALKRCSYAYPFKLPFAVRPRLKIAYGEDGRARPGTFEDWVKALHERIAKKRFITREELDNEEAEYDDGGHLVPLTNKDLCLITRLKHQNVSRGLADCREKGLVKAGFPFYLEPKPSVVPPDESRISTDAKLDQLTLLTRFLDLEVRISTDADPAVVQQIEKQKTAFLKLLSSERNRLRTFLLGLSTEPGIIIGSVRTNKTYKNEQKKGEEPPPSAAAPPSPPPPPPTAAPPPSASAAPTGTNGHTNGQGSPARVPARVDPETGEKNELYERLRDIFAQAGRPVSIPQHGVALPSFSRYPLPVCRRIVDDAQQRLFASWQHTRNKHWVPTLPEYLQKQEWNNPISAGMSPPERKKTAGEVRDGIAEELIREAQEKDRRRAL